MPWDQRAYAQRYYEKNKAKIRATCKAKADADRDAHNAKSRAYIAKRTYGLSKEEYNKLLAESDGKCLICRKDNVRLCIDHNFETKKVRGIICAKCNLGLGHFEENIEVMIAAIEYLRTKN